MLRIGLNGLGRIGRAIFRINHQNPAFQVVAINDVNPSTANMAYLLKYDSIFGRLNGEVHAEGDQIHVDKQVIPVTHYHRVDEVPWEKAGVEVVIDATGVIANLCALRNIKGVKNTIFTHSSEHVDRTVIFGVNESEYRGDFLLSSSICDANAFAPTMKLLDQHFEVEHGFLTTLHPWLGYQNLMDSTCRSFAYPGENHDNFALGRASTEALIPKTTSCVKASAQVLPWLSNKFQCLSYRVPTPVVSSADISVKLKKKVKKEEVINVFMEAEKNQRTAVFQNNFEPLISKDFAQNQHSAIVDHRWTEVNDYNYLKVILWYDNEWGYSSRVVDLVKLISERQ